MLVAALLAQGLPAAAASPPAKGEAKQAAADTGRSKQAVAKCEYVTGSRIRHDPPVDCDDAAPGVRSYSADELRQTGEINLSDALRKLDPRFQ